MPNAINKTQGRREIKVGKISHEIIIKEDGKVVYHNKAYAGVLCLVQSVDSFDGDEMSGDSQAYGFGHPIIQFFAFDQLKQKLIPILKNEVRSAFKILKLIK